MSDGTWAGMREVTQTEETVLCVDTRNKVESKRKNEYMYVSLAHSDLSVTYAIWGKTGIFRGLEAKMIKHPPSSLPSAPTIAKHSTLSGLPQQLCLRHYVPSAKHGQLQ